MINNKRGKMDLGLFVATLTLLAFGIVLVYSASFPAYRIGGGGYFFWQQMIRAFLAVILFTIFINVDYRIWSKYSGVIFIAAVIALLCVLLFPKSISPVINGARRWISVNGVGAMQVSDFARIALILFLAKKCGEEDTDFNNWRSLIPHYVTIGIICGLVILEPDLGTTVIIAAVAMAMLFMAGAKVKHLLAPISLALPFIAILIWKVPYMHRRFFNAFLHGGTKEANDQIFQSLVGFGKGGLFGTGLGKGAQKYGYVPELHTDFILSNLGEEFGFIGMMMVFLLFAFVVYRGFRISLNAPDRAGKLTAFGFTTAIAVYALINSSGVTKLLPSTGVPMPFLSYGGTTLIFTMSSMGILLNISSQIKSETTMIPALSERKRKKFRSGRI